MVLNNLANRSSVDFSQYPIFPWILSKYQNNINLQEKKYENKNKISDDVKNYIILKINNEISNDKTTIDQTNLYSPNLKEIETYKNRPKIKNYGLDPGHEVTLKDLEDLPPKEAILYDKRPFLILFVDFVLEDHILLVLFFKTSIMKPLWLRMINLDFNLSIIFAMNSMFYTDELISASADVPSDKAVIFFYI